MSARQPVTPTPWSYDTYGASASVFGASDNNVLPLVAGLDYADIGMSLEDEEAARLLVRANAEFIVRAANAHEALVDALRKAHAAMWDAHYGNGIALPYVQSVDHVVLAAIRLATEGK